MEERMKHLEFIQNVVTRMNNNSFMIKGWVITLIAAIFALAAKDANVKYIHIAIIVVPAFWLLDGFYIFTERQYRDLYNDVAANNCKIPKYSMNASKYTDGNRKWFWGVFSKTLIPFYLTIIATIVFVYVKS